MNESQKNLIEAARNDGIAQSDDIAIVAAQSSAIVARGVCRMFYRHAIMAQSEVTLKGHRRADLMGITAKGDVVIVEIKCSRADLLGDQKWPEYLEHCDQYYWAVPAGFDISPFDQDFFMPERCGLIVADNYDAEMIRPAKRVALAPARRKVEVQNLASRAMRRMMVMADPEITKSRAE